MVKEISKKIICILMGLIMAVSLFVMCDTKALAGEKPADPAGYTYYGKVNDNYVWYKAEGTESGVSSDGVTYDFTVYHIESQTESGIPGASDNDYCVLYAVPLWTGEFRLCNYTSKQNTINYMKNDFLATKTSTDIDDYITDYKLMGVTKHKDGSGGGAGDNDVDEPDYSDKPWNCDHTFEHRTISEASSTQDGCEADVCTKCGYRKNESCIPAIATAFNNASTLVNNAKGDVVLELGLWNSIPDWVMKDIATRRDINITIRYMYNHKLYEVVVPKGVPITLDPQIKYYGPKKLAQMFGAKEL